DLKIVMAHLGTTFWRLEAAELIKLHPNLYSDLAGCGSWMALAPETLVKLLSPTIPLLDSSYRGFRKLVLGSDAYVNIPGIMADAQAWYDAFCRKIGLPEDVAKGIMGDTAADWFKA
ncbi:MAG: amidohydrolase family protein, partial [Lentisphaerae bacterium]|nr:amidohydrolase family protein [Lentisphaerota bacterium]